MLFLIVKTSSLGDILQSFPVVSYLQKKFPQAKIDWVVEKPFAELLTSHPFIRKVITINSKIWRKDISSWSEIYRFRREIQKNYYDAAFDLQGNMKSGLVLSCVKAGDKVGFGRKSVSEWPNLFFTNIKKNPPPGLNIRGDYLFLAQNYYGDPLEMVDECIELGTLSSELKSLIEEKEGRKIMVCPGTFWPNKQVNLEMLGSFLKKMAWERKTHFFLIWGSSSEEKVVKELAKNLPSTLLPRMKLPQLQAAMNHMDLVIAMDSLPLHLAATTKASTLSFFGPSLAQKYAPLGPKHHVIQGNCPYKLNFEKRCPKLRTCNTGACIKNLKEDCIIS